MKKNAIQQILSLLLFSMVFILGCNKMEDQVSPKLPEEDLRISAPANHDHHHGHDHGHSHVDNMENLYHLQLGKTTPTYRYNPSRLFPIAFAGDFINIFTDLTTTLDGVPWGVYLNEVIADWNNTGTCINLRLVQNVEAADIRVLDAIIADPHFPVATHFGREIDPMNILPGSPSANLIGNYHSVVFINTGFNTGTPTFPEHPTPNQCRAIISHELGHALSFQHTSDPAFTPIPNITPINSIMDFGIPSNQDNLLVPSDIAATQYLYDCENGVYNDPEPINTSVTLNEVEPFCYPETFNLSGIYSNPVFGATNLVLEIMEVTGGISGFQTVMQEPFTGGVFSFSNVDLSTVPNFNFNPNSSYVLQVRMLGANPSVSNIVTLPIEDCDDLCIDPCEIKGDIQIQDNGEGNYIFSVPPSVLEGPCAGSYTFLWVSSLDEYTSIDPLFYLTLPEGNFAITLYIYYQGKNCTKESVYISN